MLESSSLPHKLIGVGVIRNSRGKILIARRRNRGEMAGLWEFPGGKIESGETVEQCIQREIEEELAIKVKVNHRLLTVEHTYKTFKITLYVHDCQYIHGEPQPLESEEIVWAEIVDLNQYQFPQANIQIINVLQQKDNVV
ncbi:8-oxo-dGTP diphosphatase MutT [Myxosarcina sp. GI1(2024)]